MRILLNPRMPEEERAFYEKNLKPLAHHTWLATSGTSGKQKFAALSEEALIASAEAVNQHLESTSKDIWVNPLPHFHVGGLGIQKRAALSGAKVIPHEKWNPHTFTQLLHDTQATLTALVPTQVYDLKVNHLKPPKSLRAVVVGGGPLPEHLLDEDWPLIPSYGLTECSSQVVTGGAPLSHVELKIEGGCICIKSPSLLTTYAWAEEGKMVYLDPKKEGWFHTEDRGELNNGVLKVQGRDTDFIKIGGESVDLNRLRAILDSIRLRLGFEDDLALAAVPDPRLGHVIHLLSTSEEVEEIIETYHLEVYPFEKIRHVHFMHTIPRTSLGKGIFSEKRLGLNTEIG